MGVRESERRALLALLVVTTVIVALVLRPLASALVLGAVLSAVLWPLQQRLSAWLGGRASVAAALVIVGVVVLVLVPVVAMSTFVIREASGGIAFVTSVLQSDRIGQLVSRLPDALEDPLREWTADGQNPVEALTSSLSGAMSAVSATVVATGSVAYQGAMAMLATFFFLTRKDEVVEWLAAASPIEATQTRELLSEVRRVSVAIARSTVLTAGVQTVVAAVGFLIAGAPYWAFFTAVTFFVALIPAGGASVFVLAVAGILLAAGKPLGAAFLAVWALIAVGLSDNLVKPLLIRNDIKMHGAVILFALLGGLGAFGAIGLLLGPLALAMFIAVLRIYRREYGATGA